MAIAAIRLSIRLFSGKVLVSRCCIRLMVALYKKDGNATPSSGADTNACRQQAAIKFQNSKVFSEMIMCKMRSSAVSRLSGRL